MRSSIKNAKPLVQYQNPQPPEGINTSNEHPLKEFAQLLLGVLMVIVLVIVVLNFLAGTFARFIPFEFERKMVTNFELSQVKPSAQQKYLQAMADKLAPTMDLPEDMEITVHYSDSDTVNAFATLGGNLIFFKGLIDQLKSEDELAAVMGHEIAHLKYRHPIVALGKGVTLAALLAFVSGASGSNAGEWLIGNSANLSLLKFSRDQESAADEASAKALVQHYGHIAGADYLFQHFAELEDASRGQPAVIEMFRSHPYSEKRWQRLEALAEENGWATMGELKTLTIPDE